MPKIKLKIEPRRDGRATSLNVTVQGKNQFGRMENKRNFSLNSNSENEIVLEPGTKLLIEDSVSEDKAAEKEEVRRDDRGERIIGENTPVLRQGPGAPNPPPRKGTTEEVAASTPLSPSRNTAAVPATPPIQPKEDEKNKKDSQSGSATSGSGAGGPQSAPPRSNK